MENCIFNQNFIPLLFDTFIESNSSIQQYNLCTNKLVYHTITQHKILLSDNRITNVSNEGIVISGKLYPKFKLYPIFRYNEITHLVDINNYEIRYQHEEISHIYIEDISSLNIKFGKRCKISIIKGSTNLNIIGPSPSKLYKKLIKDRSYSSESVLDILSYMFNFEYLKDKFTMSINNKNSKMMVKFVSKKIISKL